MKAYRNEEGRDVIEISDNGAGIGLSLCRQIIRLHRGEILLESREGSGTKVTLKFSMFPLFASLAGDAVT